MISSSPEKNNFKQFQEEYWATTKQPLCFRHVAALEFLENQKLNSFLDVGTGDGFFISYAREQGKNGEGLELSDTGIKKCHEKKITVYQTDISQETFTPNKKYDAIVCLDVLEHLFNPSQAIKNIRYINSEYLIISVPNFNSITARIQVLLGQIPENNTPKKGHCYWFNKKELTRLLSQNGYTIVSWKQNTILEKIIFPQLLLKLFPSLLALSFVALAKKNSK